MYEVIHRTKINRLSDGAKLHNQRNSIRGVINKNTPRTASLVLLPSLAVLAMFMAAFVTVPLNTYADERDAAGHGISGETTTTEPSTTSSPTLTIEDAKNIGIKLSSEAIVLDISPTSSGVFKSQSFTVDVSTNNPTGYTLTMTADKTALSRTSAINGSTPTIPTIPTDKTFTETNFETGYWGYKLGTASTSYLPMTTDAISISTTEEAANSSINTITFATKLNNSTPSGTYSGVTLSFVATANEVPPTYIQDVDVAWCSKLASSNNYTVLDARDNKSYTIRYINGYCWMTQNLRFLGNIGSTPGKMILTSDTSNGADATIELYSLSSTKNSTNSTLGDYAGHCNQGNGFNYACVYDSGDETTGVWYNYYAATAGTVSTDNNTANVSAEGASICPAGWHLPSGRASDPSSEFYGLFQSKSSSSWVGANSYLTAFNAVPGGYFYAGSIGGSDSKYGVWWSATADGAKHRYRLIYNNSDSGQYYGDQTIYVFERYYGIFVRCVRTS